jgi:hypothetical protein
VRGRKLETFDGLIGRIVENFNLAQLDYMFTGALAVSHYGKPRTTMDIDIVVKVTKQTTQTRLVTALKKSGLKVNVKKIDGALKSGYGIITLEDSKTPFTVDIIFSDKKLQKKAGEILNLPTFYRTPEDLILAKLRMIKATLPKERALKDEDDVKAILKFTKVDMDTVKRRAKKEKTFSIFESITKNKNISHMS